MKRPKYSVESYALDGVECSDYGRWYSYISFLGEGDSFDEVIESCSGFKCDQDGGEGPEIALDDLPAAQHNAVVRDIRRQFERNGWPLREYPTPCDRTAEDGTDREFSGGDQ